MRGSEREGKEEAAVKRERRGSGEGETGEIRADHNEGVTSPDRTGWHWQAEGAKRMWGGVGGEGFSGTCGYDTWCTPRPVPLSVALMPLIVPLSFSAEWKFDNLKLIGVVSAPLDRTRELTGAIELSGKLTRFKGERSSLGRGIPVRHPQ